MISGTNKRGTTLVTMKTGREVIRGKTLEDIKKAGRETEAQALEDTG